MVWTSSCFKNITRPWTITWTHVHNRRRREQITVLTFNNWSYFKSYLQDTAKSMWTPITTRSAHSKTMGFTWTCSIFCCYNKLQCAFRWEVIPILHYAPSLPISYVKDWMTVVVEVICNAVKWPWEQHSNQTTSDKPTCKLIPFNFYYL